MDCICDFDNHFLILSSFEKAKGNQNDDFSVTFDLF